MSDYHSEALSASRGVTLNNLKDELYSLNMRLLLAMHHHNEEAQEEIREQMTAVQAEIEHMSLGGGHRHQTKTGVQRL